MRIECPNCHQQYDVGYECLGRKVECAKCGKKFLVERNHIIRATDKKEIPMDNTIFSRQQKEQCLNIFKMYFLDNLLGLPYCNGRATRSEYWGFVFFSSLIGLVILAVAGLFIRSWAFALLLGYVYIPFVGLIQYFIQARRFHDIGKSAWWMLLNLYPIAGWILVLRFLMTDSQVGDNQWGPNPKNG